MNTHPPTEHTSSQAERWFLRLQDPDCSEAERRGFERWLREAEAHGVAYRRAERLWERLGEAVRLPQVLTLPEAALPPETDLQAEPQSEEHGARTSWRPLRLATAAAAACLVLVLGYQVYQAAQTPASEHFQTAVGETRSVTLADRSTVTLDTDSHIAVRYGRRERHIELVRGAAFFDVQPHHGRSFIVTSALGRAAVLGTRFQMRTGRNRLDVVLVNGSLRLDRIDLDRMSRDRAADEQLVSHGPSVLLRPGQQATLRREASTWQITEADVEALTAWRQQRVIFRDTPLPQAVAEVNRYSAVKLRLGDPSLASLTVNGVFRTGDPDSFVLALEATLPVRARTTPNGDRILLPAGAVELPSSDRRPRGR